MKISVYIPSYNQKDLLKQAIDSVLSQSLKPFEIIIIDDASKDGSQELIKSYENNFPNLVRSILHETNQGISKSRIDALNAVTGDYVTYVDGDDLFVNTKLEEEAKIITKYKADIAFSNFYTFIDHPDNIISIWAPNKKQLPEFGKMYYEVFTRKFPNSTLFRCELVDRNLLVRTGFQDSELKIYEDFELKIRLAKTAYIAYTLQPLTYYRNNPQGLSKSNQNLHIESFKYIHDKHISDVLSNFPQNSKEIEQRYESFYYNFSQKKEETKSSLRSKLSGYFKKKN